MTGERAYILTYLRTSGAKWALFLNYFLFSFEYFKI